MRYWSSWWIVDP